MHAADFRLRSSSLILKLARCDIGGYQVCQKRLKDRRGRTLAYEDLEHYSKVVTALKETIRLMAAIDAAIPKWPTE